MDTPLAIRFVVATRKTEEAFHAESATGRTLALYPLPFVQLRLYPENRRGLPEVYNEQIERAREDPAILVFIHDDVFITDYWWVGQLQAGLARFDLVGLAGNRRRIPFQPSWALVDLKGTWDDLQNLSGVLGHGDGFPPRILSVYGSAGQPVKLLDGVMLAGRSETFLMHGLRFDPALPFHFYDMDLCRQCEAKGVSMGTWPISAIHASTGSFTSGGWLEAYERYLAKWSD